MRRARGFLELWALIAIGAAAAISIIALLWWRLDVVSEERDAYQHRVEAGEIGDEIVAAYLKRVRANHEGDPAAVESALGELCHGLPGPAHAGSPARTSAADAGARPFARLRKDLETCRDELDRLTAVDAWAQRVGLQGHE